ncbi:ABC transporter substrate-binding protein [Marinobacter sp. HL-58]|uniref:ABC transporter substrate-binding protein n=1 Tax=Marinobacter sp. HL-58 TaxID=1479237 RepID=UPI00068DE2E5|nr:ABC transporter substrate-binding protein [Marinobacter sp. HL-58]KPQ01528.1 MAG: ABC-type cobalt uptake transport system substrate-binding component [Marinobacter sp. HL-58]
MAIRPTVSSLGAALVVTFALPAHASQDLTAVTVGHLVALDMAPLFVGVESGCFEKQGLAVDTRFFANPGDNNAALAGGSLDFNINPFTLPFFAANSGVPIRVLAAAGGWGVMEVIAQGESKLDSMEDLKEHVESDGKKLSVAVLQGDTLELIMVTELARVGLSTEDVDFIYFDDLLAMVEAFRSGDVDMLSHIKPYTSEMVENRGATMITNNATAWAEKAPNTVISTLQSTLDEEPEMVESFMNGMLCAANIINNDVDQALELLDGGNYFRVSEDVLRQAFTSAPQPISFNPDIDSVQFVVDELTSMGYVSGTTTAEDIFRTDLIESLEQ